MTMWESTLPYSGMRSLYPPLPLTRPVRHPLSRASSDSPPTLVTLRKQKQTLGHEHSVPPYLSRPDGNRLGGTRTTIKKFSRRPRAHQKHGSEPDPAC
ncbi:hypothetical protein BDP55DRAFT_685730 [Colletotrichum godetiae]|uniref:Uncharacterized protein n=1 Tax=Colletotrichum godetiae TaxID=1209918 RepID=A0AAJ0A7D0_9PEZI|nr:uncharacterized protein BDP55DRAFT_685730 [Colletotrichum godetiae]KAK1657404.1 hypothetical protein BDP55DRAFT_685730 [Colletotrichum godetiae]